MNIFPTDDTAFNENTDKFIPVSVMAKQIQEWDECLVPDSKWGEYKIGSRGMWVLKFPDGSIKVMSDANFKKQYVSSVTFHPADDVIETEEPKELTQAQENQLEADAPKLGWWAKIKVHLKKAAK